MGARREVLLTIGGLVVLQLSWDDVFRRASSAAKSISNGVCVYPVPRGGIFAALVLRNAAQGRGKCLDITERPDEAHLYVDDVVDSGRTRADVIRAHGEKPFVVLVDKKKENIQGWVSFPWERMCEESGPEENVRRLIEYIGDDPKREGLIETPTRVIRSYSEFFRGYKENPFEIMKTFSDDNCDQIVLVKDIEFASVCEHHMLPFLGRAHIAYIPDGRVIGVSKLVRLLEVFSRRLQIQERLGQQVTGALDEHLRPLGSACILEAKHLCMVCRGVNKQHSQMVTSSLTGVFLKQDVKQELLHLIHM